MLFSGPDDDLTDVLEALDPVTDKWKIVGVILGVPVSKLNQIESDRARVDKECLIEMLTDWLNCNYNTEKHGEPSWRVLAKAVSSVSGRVFRDIAEAHPMEGVIT